MAKQKKKSFGIKTTRYFTKTCSQCKFEYPNWFTNCPKCGTAWDSIKEENNIEKEDESKKNIKIVVKITEEDFDKSLKQVKLIFSADKGLSWYQMNMDNKQDYFIAEVADVPTGITIIYYIQVYLENGEIIVENNEGNYFFYKVGMPIEYTEQQDRAIASNTFKYNNKPKITSNSPTFESREKKGEIYSTNLDIEPFPTKIQPPETPKEYHSEKNRTIFGIPQVEIDPDLKKCPYCNSNIKKMWSICPICGKSL